MIQQLELDLQLDDYSIIEHPLVDPDTITSASVVLPEWGPVQLWLLDEYVPTA